MESNVYQPPENMTDFTPLHPELDTNVLPQDNDFDQAAARPDVSDGLGDMEEYDIAVAHANLKATQWKEGLVLNPCIGGVYTSICT